MSVSGKAFRIAIRQEKFGDSDVEKVYNGQPKHDPKAIATFEQEIDSRLHPPFRGVTDKPFKAEHDGKQYQAIYLMSEFEKDAEDFDKDAEVVINETLHSYVDSINGNVYLPRVDGFGPCLEYGARCNVNDQASYADALHAKGTMLPFLGGARILLELGVDVDSADSWGETALMHACAALNETTITWLLSHGADPNKTTIGSKATAMHRLVEAQGSDETKAGLVKFLVQEYKADVNAKNFWDTTALHIAAHLKLLETCKSLILCGASPKAQDQRRSFPGKYAAVHEEDSETKRANGEQIAKLLSV